MDFLCDGIWAGVQRHHTPFKFPWGKRVSQLRAELLHQIKEGARGWADTGHAKWHGFGRNRDAEMAQAASRAWSARRKSGVVQTGVKNTGHGGCSNGGFSSER